MYTNVYVLIRPNVGHDFQGWNEAMFLPTSVLSEKIIKDSTGYGPHLYTQYDKFIFGNATVSGPYLPSYVTENWVNCFTSRLSEKIKLVGLSCNYITAYKIDPGYIDLIRRTYGINVTNSSHIQSMIFATDSVGLNVLIRKGLFGLGKQFPRDRNILVFTCEVSMTTLIFDAGYDIFSFIKAPGQGVVTNKLANETVATKWKNVEYDDPWLVGRSKTTLCESMFVKINRGITFPERTRYDSFAELTYIPPTPPAPPTPPVQVTQLKPTFDVIAERPDWASAPEYGFIILRHVVDENTDRFWKKAYEKIRQFHTEPILIIDDNSDPNFVTHMDTVNCQVIDGGYPGRGEILPYFHFHRLRLWKKAIFIHDSVFLNTRVNADTVADVKFIWDFSNDIARPEQIPELLKKLKHADELISVYTSPDEKWVGCFGGMSIIDWQFLNKIVQTYDIFALMDSIKTRGERMCWERIFGLICCQAKPDLYLKPSRFGFYGILISLDNTYEGYLTDSRDLQIYKIFTGR